MSFKPTTDLLGRAILPGKTLRQFDWQVMNDTAAPAWLTLTGTATFNPLNYSGNVGGVGQVVLTTAATAGSAVTAKLAAGINMNAVEAIEVLLDGLRFDSDDASKYEFVLACHSHAQNQGVFIHQPAQSANHTMRSRIYNAGGHLEADVPYVVASSNNGQRSKSFGMSVRPREKALYVLEGEEIVTRVDGGGKWVNSANVLPGFEFITREAAAHWVSFSRLRVRIVTD